MTKVADVKYARRPIAGSVLVGDEWFACHVLRSTTGEWYEYRIDYADGSCESGVAQAKDVREGEDPETAVEFG